MAVPNVVYNINVKSKFELFLNDDLCEAEPEELVKKISEDKKKKDLALKEAKKHKHNEVKKPISKPNFETEQPKSEDKSTSERAPRFQKTDTKSLMKPKNASQVATKMEPSADDEVTDDANRGSKGKKNFGTAPKRGRGREFDRHSGSDKTGVKSVERRDGSGSYNWGNVKDVVDLSALETALPDPKEEASDEKLISNDLTNDAEKKELDKPVMTISEWKALQSNDNVISSHVPTRPANNGENVFTGMNVYQKKNLQQNESDNEVVILDDDIDSKGRRQIKVNIEFSGRARRGGRGGFSNSRFKKDDGASGKDDAVINLDEEEFPTLS